MARDLVRGHEAAHVAWFMGLVRVGVQRGCRRGI